MPGPTTGNASTTCGSGSVRRAGRGALGTIAPWICSRPSGGRLCEGWSVGGPGPRYPSVDSPQSFSRRTETGADRSAESSGRSAARRGRPRNLGARSLAFRCRSQHRHRGSGRGLREPLALKRQNDAQLALSNRGIENGRCFAPESSRQTVAPAPARRSPRISNGIHLRKGSRF
jgi:hypothetical protein